MKRVPMALRCLRWTPIFGVRLVRCIRPDRWKAFQVLRVEDENAGRVEPVLFADAEFRGFLERHARLVAEGFRLVPERSEDIRRSYGSVDPRSAGAILQQRGGLLPISWPILEGGVATALAEPGWRSDQFLAHGGLYDGAGRFDRRTLMTRLTV